MGGDGGGIEAGDLASTGPRRERDAISTADREALAVLLSVHGMGPLTLGRLVDELGSPAQILDVAGRVRGKEALIAASHSSDGSWRPMPDPVAAAVVEAAGRREAILADVERSQLRVVATGDAARGSQVPRAGGSRAGSPRRWVGPARRSCPGSPSGSTERPTRRA